MSSAANTISTETDANSTATRPDPVALELPISVTGTRANSGGARDLFTEETETVLVFRDGAVIRLNREVALGQLLFLTNKSSNAEVVCQVVRTRAFGASAAYVELQFTEAKADFWGVDFAKAVNNGGELPSPEQVEAAKIAETNRGEVIARHTEAEVDALRAEVEALRKQLLGAKQASGAAGSAKTEAPGIAAAAKPVEDLAGAQTSAVSAGTSAADVPLMPAAKEGDKAQAARAVVGMALPISKARKEEKDPSEELLPKPELDFSQMPQAQPSEALMSPFRGTRTVELRKVLVPGLVVLMLVSAGMWWMKPWKYVKFGAKKPAVTAPRVTLPVSAVVKPSNPSDAAGNVAAKKESQEGLATATEVKPANAAPSTVPEARPADAGNVEDVGAKKRRSGSPEKTRNEEAATEKTSETRTKEIAVNDVPVSPAKLIKAANPVYPPDAMRGFITGDVRAEAVVEANGQVGDVKILSGPKPLRDAAVEALKQYQYEPATQGGKAVSSKVMVTVKFWFNP